MRQRAREHAIQSRRPRRPAHASPLRRWFAPDPLPTLPPPNPSVIPAHHCHPSPFPSPPRACAAPHDMSKSPATPPASRRPTRPPPAVPPGIRPAIALEERILEKTPAARIVVELGAALQAELVERTAPPRGTCRIVARSSPRARRGCSRCSPTLSKLGRDGSRSPEA